MRSLPMARTISRNCSATPDRGAERRSKGRSTCTMAARCVEHREGRLEIQRGGDNAGILAVVEWKGRGGEGQLTDVSAFSALQAGTHRLHPHGDYILIPVRHRALTTGEPTQAW